MANNKQQRIDTVNAYLYTIAKQTIDARIVGGEVVAYTKDGHVIYIVGFNEASDFRKAYPNAASRLLVDKVIDIENGENPDLSDVLPPRKEEKDDKGGN